jgi:hypothetical protein
VDRCLESRLKGVATTPRKQAMLARKKEKPVMQSKKMTSTPGSNSGQSDKQKVNEGSNESRIEEETRSAFC